MSGPRVSLNRLLQLRAELSERDQEMVRWVHRLRYMTGMHLADMFFTSPEANAHTNARNARRSLQRLHDLGLLTRLERRVGGVRAGSNSWVYAIAPAGQRLVEFGETRKRLREPSVHFLEHSLRISQLVVDLHAAQRRGGIELRQLQTEPHSWRQVNRYARVGDLRPDLFVALDAGDFQYRWFVEVDMGTEHLPRLLAKCQTYDAYQRLRIEQERYGVFPRVMWLVHDQQRAQRLRRAIDRTKTLLPQMFLVVTPDEAISVLSGDLPATGDRMARASEPEAAA